MELVVIRHTRVAVDKGVCYGATDVPLADTFEEEASALRAKLSGTFDAVYTSPLTRCVRLAETLARELAPAVLPERVDALREINFGAWEMRPWGEIDPDALNAWMTDYVEARPPDGENLRALYARVADFVDGLRDAGDPGARVLVVAHAGVIRCLWAYWLAIPLTHCVRVPVAFGGVLRLGLGERVELDAIYSM